MPSAGRRGRLAAWLRRDRLIAAMVAVVLVPVVALSGGPAQALAPTPVFLPYVNYDVGKAHGVAIGDFTGDGRNDVVVSSEDSRSAVHPDADHLNLFAQGPDGSLVQIQALDTRLDYNPEGAVAAGDLDGDGRTDAALATGHSVELYLQRNGALAPAQPVPIPGAQQVVVADVDGDGLNDLVAKTWLFPASLAGGVVLLRGLGGGQFGPPVTVVSDPQVDVQVGDVTGDGRLDIVTCASVDIRVYAQAEDGSFLGPAGYVGDIRCHGVALGDLDGDGLLDAAFGGGGNRPSSRVDVLSQRSDGTFSPAATYRSADIPTAVATGDVNGDRLDDLVVLHNGWLVVGVHAQAPDHSLDPERLYPVPDSNLYEPRRMAVGDVNGDGRNDIVMADDMHGLVVLWNQAPGPSTTTSTSVLATTTSTTPPPEPPPPLFSAFQAYGVSSDPQTLATGDFNGDGRTDVAMSTLGAFDPANDNKLFVFLAGPAGSLAKVVRYDTESETSDVAVLAAGDLDGDGLTDLILRMRAGIDVFLQRDGGFADRKFLELPHAERVDIADLDGDGTGEMIMSGSRGITVYRSLGGHAFAPPTTVSSEYHRGLGVTDLTGDGRPDLVTIHDRPEGVEVFRQLPDGSFADGVLSAIPGRSPGELAVGDLTGDGRADVAVSTSYTFGTLDLVEIHVLAQTPSGTLAAPVAYENFQPEALSVADVDGDGAGDLVTVHNGSTAGVLLQRANGTLAPERRFALPYASSYTETGLTVTDLTGDGRPDVAVADYNHGLVVLRNVAPRSAAQQASRYVDQVFQDLVGRPATTAELAAWGPKVTSAHGRVVFAITLVSGVEYRSRRVAEEAVPRLGHGPGPAVAAALVATIAKGTIMEIAPALFLGSDEFYARSGSTAEGFVDALCLDLLGVKPDPAGGAALAAAIRGGYNRTNLAVLLILHPATRGRLVDATYQRYLGRTPSAALRQAWVDAIVGGTRSEYLVAYLVSLDEYWSQAVG